MIRTLSVVKMHGATIKISVKLFKNYCPELRTLRFLGRKTCQPTDELG